MKRQQALEYFQQKVRDNPMDADALHNLAVLHQSMGDARQYEQKSRIALLTKQGGPKIVNEMGLACLAQHQLDEARYYFTQLVQRWPDYSDGFVNMSAVLAKQGLYDEALPYGKRAVEMRPNDPCAHRNLAKIYDLLGKHREALAQFQKAHALVPQDIQVLRRMSLLSLSMTNDNSTDQALSFYQRLRDVRGDRVDLKL